MFLIIAPLLFLLAHVSAQVALPLLSVDNMGKVFKAVNNDTIGHLVWNGTLAREAREKSRVLTEGAHLDREHKKLILVGISNHGGDLKGNVRDLLQRLLQKYEGKVNLVQQGAQYGCNGIYSRVEEGDAFLRLACVYNCDNLAETELTSN